jgi:hypothetical protein
MNMDGKIMNWMASQFAQAPDFSGQVANNQPEQFISPPTAQSGQHLGNRLKCTSPCLALFYPVDFSSLNFSIFM